MPEVAPGRPGNSPKRGKNDTFRHFFGLWRFSHPVVTQSFRRIQRVEWYPIHALGITRSSKKYSLKVLQKHRVSEIF